VGDFILTMPAIELVRNGFPDLAIEILGYPSISSLAVEAGLADSTRSIEHGTMAPFFAPGADLDPETCAYFKSFDVVVSYLYDPDGFFAGNLERAGVETLIRGPFRMDETARSAPEQLAEPLGQLALFLEKPYVEVSYGEPDRVTDSGPAIAIHPGSGSASKNWAFESWINLASEIVQGIPTASFLIISGEAEEETIGDFLDLLDKKGIPYQHANQSVLSGLGRMLQACDLFLGHDSGISHLAASTGLAGLALFGPTDPAIWAPQHPAFDFIKAPGGQLGDLSWEAVRDHPAFTGKLAGLTAWDAP
jgi:heptosyltransferase-2